MDAFKSLNLAKEFSMDLIVKTRNKKEEKIVKAFLDSLDMDYFTEIQEEKALYKAMRVGKKTRRLTQKEKEAFINSLKNAR